MSLLGFLAVQFANFNDIVISNNFGSDADDEVDTSMYAFTSSRSVPLQNF